MDKKYFKPAILNIVEKFADISNNLNEVGKKSLIDIEMFESSAKELKKALDNSKSIIKSINDQLEDALVKTGEEFRKSFIESTKAIVESYKNYKEREKKYILILAKCGWPPLWDIQIHNIDIINEQYDKTENFEEFRKELDNAILTYYKKNVFEEILKRWSSASEISHRYIILNDVIKAHIREEYTLSIPTILPQIEGTIRENSNEKDFNKKALGIYIDILLRDKDEYLPVKGLIVDDLYEHFKWGDKDIPSLSRHAILHGADIGYNTEKNSLRLILIYDMLIQLIMKE